MYPKAVNMDAVPSKEKPPIALILSFPNSGTSYTLAMVEQASNRSIASNYGLEFSNGDYLHPKPSNKLSDYSHGHYTAKEKSDVASLLRALATKETWKRIRHYFRDWQ